MSALLGFTADCAVRIDLNVALDGLGLFAGDGGHGQARPHEHRLLVARFGHRVLGPKIHSSQGRCVEPELLILADLVLHEVSWPPMIRVSEQRSCSLHHTDSVG